MSLGFRGLGFRLSGCLRVDVFIRSPSGTLFPLLWP